MKATGMTGPALTPSRVYASEDGLHSELCLSPIVTGEVYCFPRRQLIFSFGRSVIITYIIRKVFESACHYILKLIPSICPSVPQSSNK